MTVLTRVSRVSLDASFKQSSPKISSKFQVKWGSSKQEANQVAPGKDDVLGGA